MTTTTRLGSARRFGLIATAAALPLMGLAIAPAAGAKTTEFGPCGKVTDQHINLWDDVKNATPKKAGSNIEVVWPSNDKSRGFAVRQGHKPAQLTDLLAYLQTQAGPEMTAHLAQVQAYRERYGVA